MCAANGTYREECNTYVRATCTNDRALLDLHTDVVYRSWLVCSNSEKPPNEHPAPFDGSNIQMVRRFIRGALDVQHITDLIKKISIRRRS
jgi:hypothetical protein